MEFKMGTVSVKTLLNGLSDNDSYSVHGNSA